MEAKTYCLGCLHKKVCGWYPTKNFGCVEFTPTVDVPDINVEKLTDEEQRLFLTAIGKEKKLCKNIEKLWDELHLSSDDDIDLVKVCGEIERKVKKALWTN